MNKPSIYQHANVNLKYDSRNKKLQTYSSKHLLRKYREVMSHQDLSLLISWLIRVRENIENEANNA